MTNHVLLNNVEHQNLKVITRYSEEFGDGVNSVITFPTEFADIQREYPIFFKKHEENGEFQSVAILGFDHGENLFLDEGNWTAHYVPAMLARGPFLIGFQKRESDGILRNEMVIHVDMDSPRISETEGEPVFKTHGGNTHYLDRIAAILRGVHEGMAVSKAMFSAFEQYDLIESVAIEAEINENQHYRFNNYYTISEEKLRNLDGEALQNLNRAGFLQGAYLVIASLNNLPKLIDMKNRKRHKEQKVSAIGN